MSRRRHVEPDYTYHVLNRGALRQQLFFSNEDYSQFELLTRDTQQRFPLPIFSYELMPNHWHFVVKPDSQNALSEFFGHLSGTHAKRFRAQTLTVGYGHVYQDRFKCFPVQSDGHFLSLCRYVERNALRARLVTRAEHWRWSSLYRRIHGTDDWLTSDWPVPRPGDWIERLHRPMTTGEIKAIQLCMRRGRPLGTLEWTRETANHLGLDHTLNRQGRPSVIRSRDR